MASGHLPPRPELLAPAQDFICLRAAIQAGCDAVYFGIEEMNLRTAAHNFRLEDIPELSQTCRAAGVKAYLTLNVIVFPGEMGRVRTILEAAAGQVDAVICWDPAVLGVCRELGLPIHVSTQASVANIEAACFYRDLGAVRVVPARECTLEDVKAIREGAGVQVETFIHGAMCVNYSGRCFLGQDVFGGSGNRGACLQPCRREYRIVEVEEGHEYILGQDYVLSARDVCAMPFLEEVLEARVDALKIEGRNRNPEYVDTTVRCYRRAIDAWFEGRLDETLKGSLVEELRRVYNRRFSDGFYHGRPIASFTGCRRSQATHRKEFVGVVTNYYDRARVVAVAVRGDTFREGDELLIEGRTTGLVRFRPAEIRVDGQRVPEAPRGVVTMKLDQVVREGDKVYVSVLRQGKSAGQ